MPRKYTHKGWTFAQIKPGLWHMIRKCDNFRTWHQSLRGCRAFIDLHGEAPNPDEHYETDGSRSDLLRLLHP